MGLGEGPKQFTVTTRLDGENLAEQKIDDPFIRTTVHVRPRGLRERLRIAFRGVRVEVRVDGTLGAQRRIMMLNAGDLQAETDRILEAGASSRAQTSGMCNYVGTEGRE